MSETGSMLLDTSVIVRHLRQPPDPDIESRLEDADQLYVSHFSLGELYYGAYQAKDPVKHLESIRTFLPAAEVLHLDLHANEHYGQIKAHLKKSGTPIPENDIWIAAIARRHGLPVATRDRHFDVVPDLEVLHW